MWKRYAYYSAASTQCQEFIWCYCPRPWRRLLAKTQQCYKIVYLWCRGHRRHLQQPLQRLYSVRDQVKQRGVPMMIKCTMSYKVVNVSTGYHYCTITYYLVRGPCAQYSSKSWVYSEYLVLHETTMLLLRIARYRYCPCISSTNYNDNGCILFVHIKRKCRMSRQGYYFPMRPRLWATVCTSQEDDVATQNGLPTMWVGYLVVFSYSMARRMTLTWWHVWVLNKILPATQCLSMQESDGREETYK